MSGSCEETSKDRHTDVRDVTSCDIRQLVRFPEREETRRMRTIEIIKMRGHKHSFVTAPYEITSGGFKVFSPELISK